MFTYYVRSQSATCKVKLCHPSAETHSGQTYQVHTMNFWKNLEFLSLFYTGLGKASRPTGQAMDGVGPGWSLWPWGRQSSTYTCRQPCEQKHCLSPNVCSFLLTKERRNGEGTEHWRKKAGEAGREIHSSLKQIVTKKLPGEGEVVAIWIIYQWTPSLGYYLHAVITSQ